MKKTAYTSSALSIMSMIMGLLFLLYAVPYSYYILALSLFLLAVSLIIFYTIEKKYMYVVGGIFCFLPMVGLVFRQLSLPGANLLVATGLILFAVTFIPWFSYKCYHEK
jgi:hypothetical protein